MADFSKARLLAAELKSGSSHRRQRVVDNIVTACEKIIGEGGKVSAAEIEKKARELGLDGPKKQSIYNAKDELGPLVSTYAESQAVEKPKRGAKASYSSDEEELLAALGSQRHKSMFREVVADRDRARDQLRLLDSFVSWMKQSNTLVDGTNPESLSAIEYHSPDDHAIVEKFFGVLYDYGFDLQDGEIVKSGKPTGSRDFVTIMQKRGLL